MKVITLGQFERDLDRILDDVTDENEHYCVKTPVISDLKEKGGLVWEDKAVMILPIEDYEIKFAKKTRRCRLVHYLL
ncbi:MAG: hypothetical protein ACE5IR_16760 [bacterium]